MYGRSITPPFVKLYLSEEKGEGISSCVFVGVYLFFCVYVSKIIEVSIKRSEFLVAMRYVVVPA
jgi:hypothetical protein